MMIIYPHLIFLSEYNFIGNIYFIHNFVGNIMCARQPNSRSEHISSVCQMKQMYMLECTEKILR